VSARQGGFELSERESGLRALREASSPEALAKLLDTMPVLYAPVFHRDVLGLLAHELPLEERWQLERFFCFLDWKAVQRLEAVPIAQDRGVLPEAPPYFQHLLALLKGKVPPHLPERPLNPATEGSRIADGLARLHGAPAVVPAYEPTPGSQWGIVTLECLRCHTQRPEVRALYIDLVRAPDLRAPLVEGRINTPGCPHCGCPVCLPAGVWVLEPPWPVDTLAVLSCLVRVDPFLTLYLPSCWRPRDAQMTVVLEARSQQLMRDLQKDEIPPGTVQLVSITYSQEELAAQVSEPAEEGAVPRLMEAAAAQLALRMEAEALTLEEARALARAWVEADGRDWPLAVPPIPLDDQGRPLRAVAQALLVEQLAEWRGEPPLEQVLLATQLVAVLLQAQRVGQAEAALARAEDLWKEAPAVDEPRCRSIEALLEWTHSDILVWKGHFQEAARRRQRAEELLPFEPEGSWWARFQLWRHRAIGALHLRREGRFDASLEAFARCIPMLERLQEEAHQEAPAHGHAASRAIQHVLSGALANCASVFLKGEAFFSSLDSSSPRTPGMSWVLEYSQRLEAWPSEPDSVQDENERRWVVAGRLLGRALELSQEVDSWRYAAAQAERMTKVMGHFGLVEAAGARASEWVDFAQRANHHGSLAQGLFFLGRLGLHAVQEGPGSLDLFESAADALLRELVSQGPYAELPSWASTLVEMSFLCVLRGADAGKAVMISESLKAALTAVHLEVGVPGSDDSPGDSLAAQVGGLTRQREALRLDAFNFDEGEPEKAEARMAIARSEQELADVRRRLGLRDARYVRWCEPSYIHLSALDDLRRRLRALGPRATYLGFSIGVVGVWVYAVWNEDCVLYPVSWPGWREDLSALDALDAWEKDREAVGQVLERVGRNLLEPVQERLEQLSPEDRLILSAAPGLFHIPFAAFPLGSQRLVERLVLSVVSGVGLFEACFDRRPGPTASALLIGVPEHDYVKPSLPFARDEVKGLESLLVSEGCQVRTLLGREATASTVLAEAAAYDVLHFACHANASVKEGVRPQLVLCPDFDGEQDSGELTDWRIIQELRLRPGALVNLSACQSARQSGGGAEVRDGLVPAVLQAGAGAVIATLWNILDARTPGFQTELYRHVLAGQPPADALALTVRRCIRGELGPALASPLVWSAFVLHGVG
jgi:hypothetical protein